jgi:DHA1 family bicyclomycin/chloramphenicol resistance-like MFS transporter
MFQSLGNAFSFSGIFIYIGAAPSFVMTILHLSVKDFGWLFIPLIGGLTFGSFMSGRLSHKYSFASMIRAGYATMGVAVVLNLAYSSFFTARIPWAVMPICLYGIGMSLAMPAMTVMTLEMFPKVRGLAASLQAFTFTIIFALGSGLICPLLFDSAFHLASGVAVGLVLSLFFWWLGTRQIATACEIPA